MTAFLGNKMTWQEIIDKSEHVLLVENSNGRIHATLKVIGVDGVADSEHAFARLLQCRTFHTLWLDYDLTRIWHIGHRETSYNVLKDYVDVLRESEIDTIVIHSWNVFGVRRLVKLLEPTGIEIIVKRHWRIV